MDSRPNLVFVFGDQWRQQATGFGGDPNVKTPHLDRFATESVEALTMVAGCPVCTPYRASLLTGQYPLTHGAFVNDVPIGSRAVYLADAFNQGGYDTAWVGKWHVAGGSRSAWVPPALRYGFQTWIGHECTHDYQRSSYYAETPERHQWDGYDATAQTHAALDYLRAHDRRRPCALFLSWGPPHNPFGTAPAEFEARYTPERVMLRPNVPVEVADRARKELAGYYAHCGALDAAFGELAQGLKTLGLEENTILIFTSDHGDMLGSQGLFRKQKPWDESIMVPFLLRWPAALGRKRRKFHAPINAPDLMPTLLGLCGLPIPETVEGRNCAAALRGDERPAKEPALTALYACFHEWRKGREGAREWRGLRDYHYSYTRDRQGPWLFYDLRTDPYQRQNLVDSPAHHDLVQRYEEQLLRRLAAMHDEFLTGEEYIKRWGYPMDANGEVPVFP